MKAAWVSAAVVMTMVAAGEVRADGVQGSNGVFYLVPFVNGGWNQKYGDKVNTVRLAEEPGHTPTEIVAVEFLASKDGTLEEVEQRLPSELQRDGVTFFGAKVSAASIAKDGKTTVDKAKKDYYRDVNLRTGSATVNGLAAHYILAQVPGGKKPGTSVFVLVSAKGAEKRASGVFDEIVKETHYLKSNAEQASDKPAAPEPEEKPYVPKLPNVAFIKEVTATSTYADKKDMYAAWRTVDFEMTNSMELSTPKTAWCEGKSDEGKGEGFTINFAQPVKLQRIEIAAGVWLNQKLFDGNNAIAAVKVGFNGGAATQVQFPSKRTWIAVTTGAKPITSITVTLDAIVKGKMNDSCISGIQLYAAKDGQPLDVVRGLPPDAIAALPKALGAIYNALDARSIKDFDALLEYPFTYEDSTVWGMGTPKSFTHANSKALAAACKAEAAKEPEENQPTKCPHVPYVRDPDEPLGMEARANGVKIRFPTGREVVDTWDLVWKNGAWKLRAYGFDAGGGPDY